MPLFLIRRGNDKFVVEADSSLAAITAWIDEKNREEREVYESKRIFNPPEFSIEQIGTYHGVIKPKASE